MASNDLEEVAEYIARGSPFYAAAVVREALAAARSLADWPERGAVLSDFNDPAIREILVRKYRLIYQVTPTEINVLGSFTARAIFPHCGNAKGEHLRINRCP
jgi:toxin ParE1/3/4